MSRRAGAFFTAAAWCVATAAAGAVIGLLVLLRGREFWATVWVGVAATAVGAMLAVLVMAPEPVRRVRPAPVRHAPDSWWADAPPRQASVSPQHRETEAVARPSTTAAETVRVVLPAGDPARARSRPAAPDLATYRRSARVVQCPRCGAFRVDVQHTGAGYAFRCRVDDHAWTWQPGTAWPATVVAARRRLTS